MPHDVFISYSHKDKSATDAICSILEENNIRCWIAPRDITPGAPFAEAIIDAIKDAKVFVLVYSSNSNLSQQVIKEVDRAVNHRLAIIPFRLEDVPMSKQLEYYVSDVHWLDALTPPLEQHIDKLRDVVKILLTMDEVDHDDIEEAFSAGTLERFKAGTGIKRIKKLSFLAAAVFAIFITVFLAIRFFDRQSEIRWAREVAIPEIRKLIGENDVWRNLVAPYRLAERAEVILGDDPELAAVFSQVSLDIDVLTEPPGASVYMKEYVDNTSEWTFLGVTPLEKVRVPIGIFRWKMDKEGYDEVLAAESTWSVETSGKIIIPSLVKRTLDLPGTTPPGMVRVPKTETSLGPLDDFFVGRFEVTNREYKAFLDAGGYQNQAYWQHPFVEDGHELTWKEAASEFIDQSGLPGPSSWMGGDYPRGQDDYPVSGVSWYEAAAYAEYAGMRLPTSTHWDVARGGMTPMIQVFQLGGFAILAPFSNFGGPGPVTVGSLSGITSYGANDMAGNVREWCWNESAEGRVIRGGSWQDNTYEFDYERQAPAMDRSPRNGIRLAFYPNPESIPAEAFEPGQVIETMDIYAQKPVADDIFSIYREQFAYDLSDLNSRVVSRQQSPSGWTHETVEFDAAYGGERILAHLFLPENVSPPYQAVIYFPGSASTWVPSSQDMENYYEFTMFLSYLVRNGRAVLYPIYKGTFERGSPALLALNDEIEPRAFAQYTIETIKDFERSVDYLETREEIDSSKLAYYGMSWGGTMGTVIPAVEKRLQTSILVAGGLFLPTRPEVNSINYIGRIKVPTLMLNGMYDSYRDELIKPAFDLLGTPPEDKRLILYETDHIPPRAEYIKESLRWLDKYLGPVK